MALTKKKGERARESTAGTRVGNGDVRRGVQTGKLSQKSPEFWRRVVSNAPDFICVTDVEGKIDYVNRGAPHVAAAELRGSRLFDLIPDTHRSLVRSRCEEAARTGRIVGFETPAAVTGAECRWYRVNVGPLVRQGKIVGLIHIARDICEERETVEALRRSEALWRSFVESVPGFVWVLDPDGTVLFANRSLHHKDPTEARGACMYDYVLPEHRDAVRCRVDAVLQRQETVSFDVRGYGEGGAVVWWRATLGPLVMNGQVRGVVAVASVVDKEKRAELEVRRARRRMEALSRRLLSVQEEERRKIAREIHDEFGQALTALRLDLVWLESNLDRGTEVVRKRLAQARGVVDSTIGTLRRLAQTLRPPLLDDLGLVPALEWQMREFEAHTGIAGDLACVPAEISLDPTRSLTVFRLFQEALTNVARHAGASQVRARVQVRDGILELSVEDDGRGITRQEARSLKSLGLIGMRERARWHGGRVEIQGTPGKGTLVRAEIPLHDRSRKRSNEPPGGRRRAPATPREKEGGTHALSEDTRVDRG